MTKQWEYKIEKAGLVSRLAELGLEGWEMISNDYESSLMTFKREVPQAKPEK